MALPAALTLLALGSALVQPDTLPARGEQEALLTLDRAAMVRLSTQSRDGTACTVVDHLRGPFQTSGAAGQRDCGVDLLLDAGEYKLRLAAPRQGRGQVKLRAVPFAEQNARPVRLEPGRSVEQPLHPGQQASYWLHLDRRQPIALRASGRTAGQVQLWRAGQWREEVPARDLNPRPRPGQPIHEWRVQGTLEAGDYLVTVYGTDAARSSQGAESDTLSVEYGFAPAPERGVAVTLPEWGSATFLIPGGDLTALLSVAGTAPLPTRLAVHGAELDGEQGACEVAARALVPECAAVASGQADQPHVLLVRGAPGTPVELRWARRGKTLRQADGEYRAPSSSVWLEQVPPGEYLVGLHDVPADRDAAPLGCVLGRGTGGPDGVRELLARDVPRVAPGRPIHRAFNTGGVDSVWFEVTRAAAYRIATGGERRNRCELYRVDGATPARLTETAAQPVCDVRMHLRPGHYALRLSGGSEGIDRLTIAADGEALPAESPPRTGCTLRARIEGDLPYTLLASRTGAVAARGLVLRALPLTAGAPVPVEVGAGETLRIPVQVDGELRVRPTGAAPAGCALAGGGAGTWREGACWVRGRGRDELVLTAPPDAPLAAWIERPPAPAQARPAPLQPWSPAAAPLPALRQDEPAFLDFDAGEAHALLFQVKAAGLYNVQTEGLLETECTLRTPTVTRLASDRGSGRGRNCLVATYLDPGTYLVTARTIAPSRGRAAVVLAQRPVHDLQGVPAEGEAFFRVPAGDLVRQRLTVPATASYRLTTTAQGAELQCRLEDREGWPLLAVPAACAATLPLAKGDLLWTQLPLTVESMRHTALSRVRPPEVLKGKGPHRVELWHRYAVQLGKARRNEFLFTLEADLDVFVELTGGMQGRLTRQGEDAVLEVIAPQASGDAPAPAAGDDGEESALTSPPEGDQPYDSGDGEVAAAEAEPGYEGDGEVEEAPRPAPRRSHAPSRMAPAPVAPPAPAGQRLALKAGRYRLVTEHSRGDVAIGYWLQLATEVLTPGTTRELPVPTRVPLRVGRPGTLRLRTRGEADVACRLLDAAGRTVAASSEVGTDWNCGLAEPLPAGDYTLVIDSETQTAGATRVTVSAPAIDDVGALAHGRRYALGEKVLAAALPALPPAAGDAVLQLALEAPEPFSCAVEDEAGAVVASQLDTRACRLQLHPLGHVFRLRAWTLERPTEVTASLVARPVAPLAGGRVAAGAAAVAEVRQAGLYRTGAGVLCAPADRSGPLAPCGPEASLEAGRLVLSGAAGEAQVALEEATASLTAPLVETRALTRRPFLQRQVSRGRAVHLLSARVAPGERAAPWCELEGGVQVAGGDDGACFAASGAGEVSTSRVLVPAEAPVEVELTRVAVPLPRPVRLAPGRHALTLAEPAALYDLPSGPGRLELLLPPAAWAVLLDGGRATDLCPPTSVGLARCAISPRGGQLLVHAPRERELVATLVTLPAAPAPLLLAGTMLEARLPQPGTLTVRVPPTAAARELEVEGAERCLVRRADGDRAPRCVASLPAGVAAEVEIEAGAGPVRAVARPWRSGPAERFGRALPSGGARLQAGEGAALAGELVVRTVTVEREALLHLRSDAGVCALAQGDALLEVGGLGGGCAVDRLVAPGDYRVAVRPFAGEPLAGAASVTLEPVTPLAEGVGPERWLAPGGAALFRFQTASHGRVGVGLQQEADALECTVLDAGQRPLATGCQAYLELDAGTYLLAVRAPSSARPGRYRPVVVGLAGARMDVPEAYLRDLFQRIGDQP